jgi:hypothetical protein
MDMRLETMYDELSRSGDLFVLLFRNDADGTSYLRFVAKDQIQKIETAPNDWETELAYSETQPTRPRPVLTPRGLPGVWRRQGTTLMSPMAAVCASST